MSPATAVKEELLDLVSATEDPLPPGIGEDGFPYRDWKMPDGSMKRFSLKPFPNGEVDGTYFPDLDERPLYWHAYSTGSNGGNSQMWWRAQERNHAGLQVVIQKEIFWDGKFRPRNEWEEYMTREWLNELEGGDADRWKGINHPDGPNHAWECADCHFVSGNWGVIRDHRQRLAHHGNILEVKYETG